jgi:hypothetical protein
LTFVTIAFAGELSNLILQARSFRIFGTGVIKRWIVIWNEPIIEFAKHSPYFERVRGELDGCGLACEVFWRSELLGRQELTGSGHRMQQILKLRAANKVTGPLYLVMDAENHAIRPLQASTLSLVRKLSYICRTTGPTTSSTNARLEQCLRAWMSCTFVFVELLPAIRIRRAECSATR